MSKDVTSGSGIGFVGLLQLVFITLKLMGYITWSWFWVMAPMWMSFCIFLLIIASVFGFAWSSVKKKDKDVCSKVDALKEGQIQDKRFK